MVRPLLSCPHNLNTDRTVSLCIVIINRMMILEVVVYHLWILEHLGHHHTTFLPVTSCLLSAIPGICPICRHKQHDIIQFLHRVDMKWSNLPAHESMSPTSLSTKWALILSPMMYLGQYCQFLIKALAKTPFFFNSRSLSTHKSLCQG